jgi:hypothetical protein
MNIPQTYEKEYLAVRYALMVNCSDSKVRADGYKNLLELCKKQKWFQ